MKKSIGKSLSYVFVFTIVAKLLGFVREMFLSYFFGATGISDAYLISQNIPGTIFLFVGTGLATCYMPVYFRIIKDKGRDEAYFFTNNILSIVLLFSTLIIIFVWTLTPYVVKVFASGFAGETLKYAIVFTRICILSLYFSSFIYVLSSFLQANNEFGVPAFSAIPNSLVVMVAIVLGAKIDVLLLSIISVIATAVQAAVLFPPAYKLRYKFFPTLRFNKDYTMLFVRLLMPVVIGVSVNEINMLVDRTLASRIAVGAISALTYSNSLIQLVQGGIVQPLVTVFYPTITEDIVNTNGNGISKKVERIESCLLAVLVPISAAIMLFSKEMIFMVFGRGAFDSTAAELTAKSFFFYSLGICAVGMREPITRLFYANSDTKTPMKNATIGMLINIVLNFVLSYYMGISGLALATSLAAMISCGMLFVECRKKLPYGKIQINALDCVKVLLSTAVAVGASYLLYHLTAIEVGANLRLILSLLLGALSYFVSCCILRVEPIIEGFRMALKIVGVKNNIS